MRIAIVAVGRLRGQPERELVDRYLRRIPWRVREVEIEAPATRDPLLRRRREGELLLAKTAGMLRIGLDPRGQPLDSEGFARLLGRHAAEPIALLVGGADGLSEEVRAACAGLVSFGPMVWPHELFRVMLAEQLYRAHCILAGHPYHRG